MEYSRAYISPSPRFLPFRSQKTVKIGRNLSSFPIYIFVALYRRQSLAGTNRRKAGVIRVPIVNPAKISRKMAKGLARRGEEERQFERTRSPLSRRFHPGMKSGIMIKRRKKGVGGEKEREERQERLGGGVKKARSGEERRAEKRRNLRFNKGCLKAR